MRAGEARRKEADHRIANGIQFAAALLRQESRRITSVAAARGALIQAANRLSAIARMHRRFRLPPIIQLAECDFAMCAVPH